MLTEIYIRNYLMLPEIRLSMNRGLTVLSGETGAGKSILIGSISLIFGDNSPGLEAYDKSLPIYLEASFQINNDPALLTLLSEAGFDSPEELILAREISPQGKSSYYLCGRKVGAALVKELKPLMIDFHHQRDQQRLLSSAHQLELLDAYAEAEPKRVEFASLYRQTRQNMKHLEELCAQVERQKQLQELYQFQFEELENAKLLEGEDTALQQEFELLSHSQEISEISSEINRVLFENDNSIFDQLGDAYGKLKRFASLNSRIKEASLSLYQAMEGLKETSANLNGIGDNIIADPDRLNAIQSRLDTINSLVHKHKVHSILELIGLFKARSMQIAAFADQEEAVSQLKKLLAADFVLLKKQAAALTDLRASVAGLLSSELRESIRELNIPQGMFEIRIDKKSKAEFLLPQFIAAVSETGQDAVDFLFSANPGFELKPLSAVVSGGELSRILLAIKKVLASRIPEKLIILDEIDAGIGGKTAGLVADFIYSLAKNQQILCITHLAQIAAVADCHIAIEKQNSEKHSSVTMRKLEAEARLQELARMLSGKLSDTALEHARELLKDIKKRGYSGQENKP